MEFFNKSNLVRLRSHLDKFLLADEDLKTVRQSRQETSNKVRWTVELVEGNSHLIRLKSSSGQYLTASEEPLLLGMTGLNVLQTPPPTKMTSYSNSLIEWEPIRDGFQVKLRSKNGTFLRANGATKPWRNTITHDIPRRTSTHNWILWDVLIVESSEIGQSFADFESRISSFSSFSSRVSDEFPETPTSPWAGPDSNDLSLVKYKLSSKLGMEFFHNAKSVRLKGHHNKFLVASTDEESVTQDRNGSSKTARWTVEFIPGGTFIRLKSCFGKYLTASNAHFLLGMTGCKVTQTLPRRLDSSVEWEPVKDHHQLKLKTRYGNFLRANGGLPPWRNSVTHDVPQRTATQEWVLWDVDVLEIQVNHHIVDDDVDVDVDDSPRPIHPLQPPPPPPPYQESYDHEDEQSLSDSQRSEVQFDSYHSEEPDSPISEEAANFRRNPSVIQGESFVRPPSQQKIDGRVIYYSVADDNGDVDEGRGDSFVFKGNNVDELTEKLREETELGDIIVCTRSPLNGKLIPLRLRLPPNNTEMHVVVVESSSRAGRNFINPTAP